MHACKTCRAYDPLEMATMNQTCCSMRFKQQTIPLSTISFKLGMMPTISYGNADQKGVTQKLCP